MLPDWGPPIGRRVAACALIAFIVSMAWVESGWARPGSSERRHFVFASAGNAVPLASIQMERRLQAAIQWYQSLGTADIGPPIPSDTDPGPQERRRLRQRLALTGDFTGSVEQDDPKALSKALASFQRRHGLAATGQINRVTLAAMNIPIAARLDQLRDALLRVRELRQALRSSRYIQVNIPAQELTAIANGTPELVSTVIIGRRNRQTPVMTVPAQGVDFFPTWRVPFSIIESDLFGRLASDPGYFARNDYTILDAGNGQKLTPAQVLARGLKASDVRIHRSPGSRNPLGRIRINMPNDRAIYLHDTPGLIHFGWPDRALSHGCVRVSRIVELAAWLLSDSGWSMNRISDVLHSGRAQTGWLTKPVPVHLVYVTAWVETDSAGQMQVHFRPDIYGLAAS